MAQQQQENDWGAVVRPLQFYQSADGDWVASPIIRTAAPSGGVGTWRIGISQGQYLWLTLVHWHHFDKYVDRLNEHVLMEWGTRLSPKGYAKFHDLAKQQGITIKEALDNFGYQAEWEPYLL